MQHFIRSLCILPLFSFMAFAQEPNWNQWRGPNSTNHSFSTGIAPSWGAGGPRLLWKTNTVGNGYSSITFYGDKMFTMGDLDNQSYVFALDRNTGKEIWKSLIGKGGDGGGGYAGTLGTPACDGETVYAMNQFSEFAALDVKDGSVRWRKNTQNDLGGRKLSGWGYSQSPILDGDKIVIPIGGEGGTLAAFSKSGELLWRSAELKDTVTHVSAVPVEIAGVPQYLLLTGGTSGGLLSLFGGCKLVGFSPADGKILWQIPFRGRIAVCSDPVLCGDVVMASTGYDGADFYRITKEGNEFKAVKFHENTALLSHHGGIVAVGDHFYLLSDKKGLTCVEAKTGKIVWENRSIGKGSLTYADGKLIARSERGPIVLVEAAPEGCKELGRFTPDSSERNTWSYPVVVDKKLYLRDQNVLFGYDLN